MKRKMLVVIGTILLLIIAISFTIVLKLQSNRKRDIEQIIYTPEGITIYDKEENKILDILKENETISIIENTTIQGIVEVKYDDLIYIFGGCHFGEAGYEIEEYSTANIVNKEQTCIDYFTLEEHDISYIEEGDLLICTGDLIKREKFVFTDIFDTKENVIVVLKESDYARMKDDKLKSKEEIITIGDVYLGYGDFIYIVYDLVDDTNSNTVYHFPFAEKVYITDNTEITGEIGEGKKAKVEYYSYEPYYSDNPFDAYEGLELKSIEVIE